MNALQIRETKREAKLKSETEYHKDQKLYVLIKNGTHYAVITTEPMVVRHYVQDENYSLYTIYLNGEEIEYDPYKPVWEK